MNEDISEDTAEVPDDAEEPELVNTDVRNDPVTEPDE